jgi:hypothetical protein
MIRRSPNRRMLFEIESEFGGGMCRQNGGDHIPPSIHRTNSSRQLRVDLRVGGLCMCYNLTLDANSILLR